MSQVVGGLSALRNDLTSGKLKLVAATYLNSQLVSTTLARKFEVSNGFGVNRQTSKRLVDGSKTKKQALPRERFPRYWVTQRVSI